MECHTFTKDFYINFVVHLLLSDHSFYVFKTVIIKHYNKVLENCKSQETVLTEVFRLFVVVSQQYKGSMWNAIHLQRIFI